MPEIASAFVSIAPSMKGFRSGVTREVGASGDQASGAFGKRFGSKMAGEGRSIGRGFGKALALGITGVAAGGVVLLKNSINEAIEAQKVGAITNQIIKATGRAAKVSARQVGDLSTELSNKAGVDDEVIQSGANLLLTFKNVRNEVGRGSKIFDRATAAAVDLSAAGFGSIESGSKMLGKALNDPVKGITALSRAGVTFSDQQKKQIKRLAESGKVLEAQKIILKEVEGQVGGTAAASATAGEKMSVAWGNVQEQIGTALLPVMEDLAEFALDEVVPAVEELTGYLGENKDEIRATAKEWGGRFLTALGDVWDVAKPFLDTLNKIPGPLKEMALQGGLIAAAMKKIGLFSLTANMTSFGTSADVASQKTDKATRSLGRFAGAARNAAGIGGLLALTKAGDQSNDAIGGLMNVMGGAGVGFMLAGPWGALAGGVAGAAKSLWDAERAMDGTVRNARALNGEITRGIAKRMKDEADTYYDWAVTLNNGGKVTLDTIKKIKEEITTGGKDNSLLISLEKEMETLGLTSDVVTKAMTGHRGAMREVATAMAEASNGSVTFKDALKALRTNSELSVDAYAKISPHVLTFAQGWSKVRGEMSGAQQDFGKVVEATKHMRDEIRKPIRTLFRTNAPDTTTEIAKLAKQLKLTPPDIKTVIKLSGVDTSAAHIQALVRQMDGLPPKAKEAGEKAGKGLAGGTGKGLRDNRNKWIGPYKAELAGGGGAADDARRGGEKIGRSLAQGTAVGITEHISEAALAARMLATRAKQAAERDLGVHSPSRVFAGIGKNVVRGFVQGIDTNAGTLEAAMSRVVTAGIPSVAGVRYSGATAGLAPRADVTAAATPGAAPLIGVANIQAHDYQDFERQIQQRKQRAALGGVGF